MKGCVRTIIFAAVVFLLGNGAVFGENDLDKGRLTGLFGRIKTIKLVVEQSYEQAPLVRLPIEENVRRILETSGFRVVNASNGDYDAQMTVNVTGQARSERYNGGPQYSGAQVQGRITLEKEQAVWWEDLFIGDIPPPEVIIQPMRRPENAPFAKALNASGFQLSVYAMTYALGIDRSLNNIVTGLKDRQVGVKCKALDEMERFFIPDAFSLVRPLLSDSEPRIRARAVRFLGVFQERRAFESFLDMLEDKDVDVKRQAAWALGELRDPRAVPPLINAMKQDIFIQAAVAGALIKIGESSVDPILDLLQEGNIDDFTREAAIDTLGELKNPKAVGALIKALGAPDGWVRRKAIDALGKIGPDATNQLIAALKEAEPQIREGAIDVLGRMKSPLSLEPLIASLKDAIPAVRSKAAWALGELGDERAWGPLNTLAGQDPDPSVRDAALRALSQIRFD